MIPTWHFVRHPWRTIWTGSLSYGQLLIPASRSCASGFLRSPTAATEDGLGKLRMAFDELLEMRLVFVSNGCRKFRVTSSPTREP
jgi:hypothetical protein